MKVLRFREKPDPAESRELFEEGCLWNTMVMAARAEMLWTLGHRHLPDMMSWFDAFLMMLRDIDAGKMGPEMRTLGPGRMYRELITADFSKDILEHAAEQTMVLPMEDLEWSDWGSPQRVTETLSRLSRLRLYAEEGKGFEVLPAATDAHAFASMH